MNGGIPNKQLKMVLGWAAFHQDELRDNWILAEQRKKLFEINPLN
jgi:hypothetical protein